MVDRTVQMGDDTGPPPQEKIGKYVVEKEIGRGGMGVVYKGRDPETSEDVAIKVLPVQLANDPDFLNRFRREVQALQRLDHPAIVRILAHGREDGSHFYAMEYVEGGSLDDILEREQKLEPLRAVQLVIEVAEALQYSHEQRIIHRDIKPANILITQNGKVKLTDFGIAKLTDATRLTATATVVGTVEYMSPEQALGSRVDHRTDIYSLGVVLYRAVTGHMPISGSNSTEIMLKLRTFQVEAPSSWQPDLPRNLSDLIMQMLEKDPTKRVPSAQALVRELNRVHSQLEAGQTGRRPTAVSDRVIRTETRQATRSWQFLWLVAGVLCLALIGYCGYRAFRPVPPEERMARAEELIKVGSPGALQEAVAELRELIRKHPTDPHRQKAEILIEEFEPQIWAKLSPRRLFGYAQACEKSGNLKLAKQLYELITEHYPASKHATKSAGRILIIRRQLRPDRKDEDQDMPESKRKPGS